MPIILTTPNSTLLPSYISALERSWTRDGDHDPEGASAQLARIAQNAEEFLASLTDLEGAGPPVVLNDGSTVPRLSRARYWISDGEFAGDLSLRWQKGTSDLPAYCLGHLGYAVLPWKRGRNYAAQAILQLAPLAQSHGLSWIDIAMGIDNLASRRSAEKAGAVLLRQFNAGPEADNQEALLFRLDV
ncbi:GNAT family N-acetyltransferase [Iodobacter fluviatilis]|uniref:Acetyltransferase n=1 Tax=Iodobacter fluviatilis TaxID=537 RepID=A0A377Q7C8_9NEIS|nr:GNAT family N-acetyltransferase [Iodobacter fluviatilis]TCU88762.1 putative acetyltransferase [Iodobacter fluviatilis]STQ91166.1 Predicted acetyltransferase [Iodobacter fluviatilis]